MAEELGRIEKPEVEQYRRERKLLFVPLLFSMSDAPADFIQKCSRYWEEIDAQLGNLESKLGAVTRVYHELILAGGEAGCKAIEELNSASYRIVRRLLDGQAELQPIEDVALLTEFMDWSRCLAIGLQNETVFARVYESYEDVLKRRYEDIAKKIDETLKESETGLLLMREGHSVQFPRDIQVLYVSPPSLDEIKRWLRDRERQASTEAPDQHGTEEAQ